MLNCLIEMVYAYGPLAAFHLVLMCRLRSLNDYSLNKVSHKFKIHSTILKLAVKRFNKDCVKTQDTVLIAIYQEALIAGSMNQSLEMPMKHHQYRNRMC
jgi:hypothetical protein